MRSSVLVQGARDACDGRTRPDGNRVRGVLNQKTGSLTQVGHEPLMNRGMNAAMAIQGDYAYIGSRTDGGHEGMPHGGIMIVDISDPSDPSILGPPLFARPGESSRELRVWSHRTS